MQVLKEKNHQIYDKKNITTDVKYLLQKSETKKTSSTSYNFIL